MNDVVSVRGKTIELQPGTYWHLTAPNSFMLHNAYLGEGLTHSISITRIVENNNDFVSPYSFARGGSDKEVLWERTRQAIDQRLPTRDGAFFLFETEADADKALSLWFAQEPRIKLKARLPTMTIPFSADSKWLDGEQKDWQEQAIRYWRGERTKDPHLEVVVLGSVYFPEWENKPFGLALPR